MYFFSSSKINKLNFVKFYLKEKYEKSKIKLKEKQQKNITNYKIIFYSKSSKSNPKTRNYLKKLLLFSLNKISWDIFYRRQIWCFILGKNIHFLIFFFNTNINKLAFIVILLICAYELLLLEKIKQWNVTVIACTTCVRFYM